MAKHKVTLLTLLSLLLLTSCNPFSLELTTFSQSLTDNPTPSVTEDGYYRPDSYARSLDDMYRRSDSDYQRHLNLHGKGEQNILVIPVEFPNYPATKLDKNAGNDALKIIHNGFFGTETATQWESVASYYYKSSYGQLLIGGEVTPWVMVDDPSINNAIADYETNRIGNRAVITQRILRYAVTKYKNTLSNLDQFTSKYDRDHNGWIDAVFLIYSTPAALGGSGKIGESTPNSSLFWAYSVHDVATGPNLESPNANVYAWAGYDFLYPKYSLLENRPDSHTIIHESGHLLGLPDYYNTTGGPYNPTGTADMMDYSLGDHTAFSKMLLDWSKPYVVEDTVKITIKPFASSGEFILLRPNWNQTAFDEYLLIEFYTPTGLNYLDATSNQPVRLFSNYGVKVYHVNAVTEVVSTGNEKFRYDNSLTKIQSDTNGQVLYRLLEQNGTSTFKTGKSASNRSLFYAGDQFGVDAYNGFKFYDGVALNFSFRIEKIAKTGATISFTKHA